MKSGALVIKKGGFPGTAYDLSAPETLIGRHPATDITLVDEGVSREHAVVTMDDDGFSIEDLQSTNGTKLNGKRVRSATLTHGDRIQVGHTVFEFLLGAAST